VEGLYWEGKGVERRGEITVTHGESKTNGKGISGEESKEIKVGKEMREDKRTM
jgi:hypothetical protein